MAVGNNNPGSIRRSSRQDLTLTANRNMARQARLIRIFNETFLDDPSAPISLDNLRTIDSIFEDETPIQLINAYLNCYFNLLQHANNEVIEELLDTDIFADFVSVSDSDSDSDNIEVSDLIEHVKTYTCIMAASYARIDVLEMCKRLNFNLNSKDIIFRACANLHTEVVEWAIRNGCPFDFDECMEQVRNHPNSVNDLNGTSIGDRIEQLLT